MPKTTKPPAADIAPGPDSPVSPVSKRRGRPPRGPDEKEDQCVQVYMTKALYDKVQALGSAAGIGASGWFKLQAKRARLPAADAESLKLARENAAMGRDLERAARATGNAS